jgi:hypothetical protein
VSRATNTFAAAISLFEAAQSESRVEQALSESRVARLRAAAELERAGKLDEARVLIEQVRAEQEETCP